MKYVATIAALAFSNFSFGVCLDRNPSIKQELSSTPLVIEGSVISEKAIPEPKNYYEGYAYTVKITKIFKGPNLGSLVVFSENSSGRFPMEVGASYLLFLHKELGQWQVNNCGNSSLSSEAAPALSVLTNLRR